MTRRDRLINNLFTLLARIEARRVLWRDERHELERLRQHYARMNEPAPEKTE